MDLASSTLISQAGQMQTHGLPNDILFNLNPICVMLLLPVMQGWVYPFLAKKGVDISPQRRIGVGLVFSAISMAYTAGVQAIIYDAGPCFQFPLHCKTDAGPNNANVGLQTPTYVFLALCEILTLVAGTELAYTQAPAGMKSIVQAVFILFSAVGAAIGIGLSFVAEDPNMTILYSSLAGLMLATAVAFALRKRLRAYMSRVWAF